MTTTDDRWVNWEARLERARPARYASEDLSWAAALIDDAIELMDADQALYELAVKRVRTVERTATAKANRLLREVASTGTLPLDWMDAAALPIVVEGERLQLGTCAADDLRRWELHERRRCADQFSASNASCDGAKLIAAWMTDQGVLRFRDLGEAGEDAA